MDTLDMLPGDTRTITTRDGKGITITRTSRPFVFDLRDAYNASMSREAQERGLEWYVDGVGGLKLGTNEAWSRQQARLDEQRRETATSRALQRSFEALR